MDGLKKFGFENTAAARVIAWRFLIDMRHEALALGKISRRQCIDETEEGIEASGIEASRHQGITLSGH